MKEDFVILQDIDYKQSILDIISRAIDHGLLAEVCDSFLESDARNELAAFQEAAREWDLVI